MDKIFGAHINLLEDVEESFRNYPSRVAQIIIGPCMCKGKMVGMTKISDIENIPLDHLIIHASLMINLANEKTWGLETLQTTLREANRIQEMNEKLKVGVVVHIGRGAGATIERVVEQLNRLVIPDGITLYLENAAGAGHEIGINIDELMELFEELPKKIKLCIDTQHTFASGFFGWKGKKNIEDFFELLESYLPGRLKLFHLNDSMVSFGSRVDRHENLLEGYIWKESEKDLKYLLKILLEKKIPLILETPNPLKDLNLIRSYFKDEKDQISKSSESSN